MTTPFSSIYYYFDNNLPDGDIASIVDDKRKRFLTNVMDIFNGYVRDEGMEYEPNYEKEEFQEDLSSKEKKLLGFLMYQEYLNQERLKALKILSIKTDSMSVTGSQDKVRNLETLIKDTDKKISQSLANFYD